MGTTGRCVSSLLLPNFWLQNMGIFGCSVKGMVQVIVRKRKPYERELNVLQQNWLWPSFCHRALMAPRENNIFPDSHSPFCFVAFWVGNQGLTYRSTEGWELYSESIKCSNRKYHHVIPHPQILHLKQTDILFTWCLMCLIHRKGILYLSSINTWSCYGDDVIS